MSEARDKLSVAVQHLMVHAPWFTSILLRLDFVETNRCPVAATNGKKLYFNPEAILEWPIPHICYLLIHEVLHIVLLHTVRRAHREHELFNVACDYAINPLITENLVAGIIEQPGSALIDPRFTSTQWDQHKSTHITQTLEAEVIYETLIEEIKQQQESESQSSQSDNQSEDGADGDGDGESESSDDTTPDSQSDHDPEETEETADDGESDDDSGDSESDDSDESDESDESDDSDSEWDDPFGGVLDGDESDVAEIREAISAADFAQPGTGSASLDALLDKIRNPKKDWREEIDDVITTVNNADDYDRRKFNRRLLPSGVFAPGLIGSGLEHVVIGLDLSGSMNNEVLQRAWEHVRGLLEQFNVARVSIVHCDYHIGKIEEFENEPLPEQLTRCLAGGTAYGPVFDWVEESGEVPDILVYFTDLENTEVIADPGYPVLWATEAPADSYWIHINHGNLPGNIISVND